MTIREVLNADWNVDKIAVTVRDAATSKYIMQYCIGRDVEAGRSERFLYETPIGDMHSYGSGMKVLYMNRIIQHCQLENLPANRTGLRGVLEKEIPKEILDLPVHIMKPYDCGKSSELHGYCFDCYVNTPWPGIDGEYEQIQLELEE